MPVIFIRHADKGIITDDDPLLPGQESKVKHWSNQLVSIYGEPDYIMCSPYLRTRQTAELLSNNHHIHIDPILSEYQKASGGPYYIRTDTLAYNPPIGDTKETIFERVKLAHDKYIGKNLWLICHGCFHSNLSKLYGCDSRKVPTLSAAVLFNNKLTIIYGPQGNI